MGKLVYSALTSLDGYIADEEGRFNWAEPDAEVHTAVNELSQTVGTYLLGRRMYEVLAVWDRPELTEGQPDHIRDFAALWKTADKVVYSTSLPAPTTANTRLERDFDPDAVRAMKTSKTRDLAVAGPTLAVRAVEAVIVDEIQPVVSPAGVGARTTTVPYA